MGFTGTREGLTNKQYDTLARILVLFQPYQLQHGDCVGADETAHYMALSAQMLICIRPPVDGKHRAWCPAGTSQGIVVCSERPYIARNHDIVKYSSYLVACPKETMEVIRSGTWATVRYAEKYANKPVYIIFPDGHVDRRPEVG